MEPKTVTLGEGRVYTLDRHGFLDPPEQWDEAFAEGMAGKLGISGSLTEEHWSLIRYLRRKFIEERTVPVVVYACVENDLRLGKLRALFPTGYHRGACRMAGINYDFMYTHNIWLTHETYRALGSEHRLTPMGFLEDSERWSDRFAQHIASEWNLPGGLTEKHWEVIQFLRDFYGRTRNIPTVFEACRATRIDLDELREHFPDGYRRGACRIAGLPFFP